MKTNYGRPDLQVGAKRSRAYTQRPRRIPPELAADPDLASCGIVAELMLYKLITLADDQGRLFGGTGYLRSQAFGQRDDVSTRKVSAALDELASAGFVLAYQVDGKPYVQLLGWWDTQAMYLRRAYPSRHPAPENWTDIVRGLDLQEPDPSVEEPQDDNGTVGTLSAESPQTAPPYPYSSTSSNGYSSSPPAVYPTPELVMPSVPDGNGEEPRRSSLPFPRPGGVAA